MSPLRETINEMIDKLVTESVDAYADEKIISRRMGLRRSL